MSPNRKSVSRNPASGSVSRNPGLGFFVGIGIHKSRGNTARSGSRYRLNPTFYKNLERPNMLVFYTRIHHFNILGIKYV